MSDDEDFGFEYSDDDQEEEDVNIENRARASLVPPLPPPHAAIGGGP